MPRYNLFSLVFPNIVTWSNIELEQLYVINVREKE